MGACASKPTEEVTGGGHTTAAKLQGTPTQVLRPAVICEAWQAPSVRLAKRRSFKLLARHNGQHQYDGFLQLRRVLSPCPAVAL